MEIRTIATALYAAGVAANWQGLWSAVAWTVILVAAAGATWKLMSKLRK